MKVTIDIPQEFEGQFNSDRFKDSLKRIITDVTDEIESDFSISGKYEIELCEMLIEALKKAKLVKCGRWIKTNDDTKKRCSECDVICLIAQYPHGEANFCPNCGALNEMDGDSE